MATQDPKGPWVETYGGDKFYLFSDCESGMDIESISHSLSLQCRYNGHCARFYTVAEHCVLLSKIVPERLAKAALMHDASEAYLSDIPHPFKPFIDGYKELEDQVMVRMARKYGLEPGFDSDPEFKAYDHSIQHCEAEFLMPSKGKNWDWEAPLDIRDAFKEALHPYKEPGVTPYDARKMFRERYEELFGDGKQS